MTPSAPVDSLTGLEAAPFAVYVHFPYCLSKCPYCDFASTAAPRVPSIRYTEAILRELSMRAQTLGNREVHSIYFGGGTPSLWAPACVGTVLKAVADTFRVAAGCEITLEANPGASDAARFAGFRDAGVNRLSVGIQSFDAQTLSKLGRAHDGAAAREAVWAARSAGFTNVSVDIIYGVHGQTLDQVRRDADQVVELETDHVSAYALTLDAESLAEEVPLAKQLARGDLQLPSDENVVSMQRAMCESLRRAGFARYEISNFAKPGFHSRHNAAYWTGGSWLAVGTGATGSLGSRRYANHRSAERYLSEVEAQRLPEKSSESLSAMELFEERVAMGLRLTSGIDVRAACAAFGQDFGRRDAFIEQLVSQGLARLIEGRLQLTDEGMDVHSAVSARLM